MFTETRGINTHKGVVFSIGILLASYGFYLQYNQELLIFTPDDTKKVIAIMKEVSCGLVERELSYLDKKVNLTNGEKFYQKHGITGVRGEAERGFPTVMEVVIPYLRKSQNHKTSDRLLNAFFY